MHTNILKYILMINVQILERLGWEGGGANIFFVYLRDYILARRHSTILKDHLKNVQGRTDPRGKGHRVQCVHCTRVLHNMHTLPHDQEMYKNPHGTIRLALTQTVQILC